MTQWKVGDRVVRLDNIHDQKSRLMHGTVTKVEESVEPLHPVIGPPYEEIDTVQWDLPEDRRHGSSYLPHGLQREPSNG